MAFVDLSDDEMVLLDGKCRPEIQEEVAASLSRIAARASNPDLTDKQSGFIADVVAEATKSGRLVLQRVQIRYCGVCGKGGDYSRYPRNGKHHRKGDKNYSKPIYLIGRELTHRFVRVTGSPAVGCCEDCWVELGSRVGAAVSGLAAEIPKSISGIEPLYSVVHYARCGECGWSGHEHQMGKLPTMMGDGSYFGACPLCTAKNTLFNTKIKLSGSVVVDKKTNSIIREVSK